MVTTTLPLATQTIVPGPIGAALTEMHRRASSERLIARIAAADPSVWTSDPTSQKTVANRLGWLRVASAMQKRIPEMEQFASGVFADGIRDVVLLGMGGSSLCPSVFGQIFPRPSGRGEFLVLDSTVPSAVKRVEKAIDLSRCLFVSASKSGKTIETLSHTGYFWEKVTQAVGPKAGEHFAAITDQGSSLEEFARARHFRRVFLNPADIGGRYSALSYFGLVPGVLAGVPLQALLNSAVTAESEGLGGESSNSAVELGLFIGAAAKAGRDKLTFIVSPVLRPFVPWIEQLVAESTGKRQSGIVPIENEPLADVSDYGSDRAFVFFQLEGSPGPSEKLRSQLTSAGHPVAVISVADVTEIGGEFFRWELATAVAGWALGVNPFDEPNVQESKDNTQKVLAELVSRGKSAMPRVIASADGISVLAASPAEADSGKHDLNGIIQDWVEKARECSYISILAYLDDTSEIDAALNRIRKILVERTQRATLRGYGPRYLHSIGQLYKGGPPTGAFLLITADDPEDAVIPGASYTFSTLKTAQALGDAESLVKRGRPLLQLHFPGDQIRGLNNLASAIAVHG
jgi:glucose-6-phosphate isomerase